MYNYIICGFEEETSVLYIFHLYFWYTVLSFKLSNKIKTIATLFYSFILRQTALWLTN